MNQLYCTTLKTKKLQSCLFQLLIFALSVVEITMARGADADEQNEPIRWLETVLRKTYTVLVQRWIFLRRTPCTGTLCLIEW